MSAATTTSRARLAARLVFLALAGAALARPTAAQQTGISFGRVPPVTFENLLERTVVPAAVAGHPTSAVASRVLAAADWPVARFDTTRNALLSQWLAFDDHSGGCPVRVRLLVLPLKGDTANVALAVQLWLLERIGTEAAQRFAESLFSAFHADVVAVTPPVQPAPPLRPRLPDLINYNDRVRQFMACGVGRSM